ncbi:hypothetical protein G3O06_23520 [Burkholderia sp. Ac-20345]|uniref:hypothetical protein n=1 Tax=Burkholderia sp. Ac-20345 TaxID=2703891 RepID=UPI00197B25B7|nr:hypothetical protein [Burkholderia sp. Ac-20345]MBN3780487.1 hypothetical protein [Burkholderia sp. Ac-20345]
MDSAGKMYAQQLLRRELTDEASEAERLGGEPLLTPAVEIEHPCDRFARQAGYGSWAAALVSMRDGHIASAPGPRIGPSTHDLFAQQIRADGLVSVVHPGASLGLVSVGLRESFPGEIQAVLDEGRLRSAAGSVYLTEFSRTRKNPEGDKS